MVLFLAFLGLLKDVESLEKLSINCFIAFYRSHSQSRDNFAGFSDIFEQTQNSPSQKEKSYL